MKSTELVAYWVETSDDDYETMIALYEKKRFPWCLFVGHIVVEKLLKGLYARRNAKDPYAPKSHDLLALANRCGLEIDQATQDKFDTITDFNMTARYDDYKKTFYATCTKEFTDTQIATIKELRIWLKKLIAE